MKISDELINNCKKNKRDAQKELFKLLLPYLSNLCFRYLREKGWLDDVIQDSFIKIFLCLEQFDSQKGQFKSWAGKIAINSCLEFSRKAGIDKTVTLESASKIHDSENGLQSKTNEDFLLHLVSTLQEDNRVVFLMYCVDGFNHREIAETLGIEISSSRKRLSRARKKLKKKYITFSNGYKNQVL